MTGRRGEENIPADRSSRFYKGDDGWYLRTREGISVGPYVSEFETRLAASLLSPVLAQLDSAKDTIAAIHAFAKDPAYGPTQQSQQPEPAAAGGQEQSAERRPSRLVELATSAARVPQSIWQRTENIRTQLRANRSAAALDRLQRELRSTPPQSQQ